MAQNPIQFARRTPPSAFQVLMSEKRPLPWLNSPPDGFLERYQRTKSQRQDAPKISFEVVGSTGNIYRTIIGKVPTCDCPDVRFRKVQCKHMCFDTYHTYSAPYRPTTTLCFLLICCQVLFAMDVPRELRYQRSFLPSELREVLATLSLKRKLNTTALTSAGDRKPVEGGCPICFNDFKPNQKTTWCQECGSNFHQACFEKWGATMQASDDVVRCLYCPSHILPSGFSEELLLTMCFLE
ncbi:hypothetical protein N7527_003380 [Penicillium freii]|nr:hypothetical protein N7527_003380 [Penicillium freii]